MKFGKSAFVVKSVHWIRFGLVVLAVILASCGGGSGGSGGIEVILSDGDDDPPAELDPQYLDWQEGVFFASSLYANRCASPRTGTDPFNDDAPYPDIQGSVEEENFFLRSWTNETYLWYDEVDDQDPGLFETLDYFAELKTEELTTEGAEKDNFHFTQDTAEYLTRTVGGTVFGYGMNLIFERTSPPRNIFVRDVVPGSPAALGGVERGMVILEIDGVDVVNAGTTEDVDVLNDGFFPDVLGEDHDFVFQPAAGGANVPVTLSSANVDVVPVKDLQIISTPSGDVGYLHFNSHIEPAEQGLYDAFTTMETAGVTDLVLDMRYNGGGLLYMAAQVGYMIAGSQSLGDVFFSIDFNDKITPQSPIDFQTTSLGWASGISNGTALPRLNLNRVFILSTSGTCSASEAVINGLRGIGVEVILIGSTTCGKPYGFYPESNCGTTYFSVQFQGSNALGFGEYPSGFAPANESSSLGVSLAGCYVEDDFSEALGDPNEAMLAAALQYRESATCPALLAKPSILTVPEKVSSERSGLAIEVPEFPALNNAYIKR